MTKIIGVRFKPTGKMYFFDPLDFDIRRGMHVVVQTSRGIEYGEVTMGVNEVDEKTIVKPLKGVLRIATDEDTEIYKSNKQKEKEAYKICKEKIREHGLDMKLIEVEYTFDNSKILFYFTSDGRVDFRELVKDLAAVFRTRIELRQIGVRDESKTMGSIGMCGRNLCCSQFLNEFVPVSVKMAKEQGLSLNPTKISGVCGRLMCCLKYEQDTYEALMCDSPKAGEVVDTPEGKGTVVSVALLRGKVKVRLEGVDEMSQKEFDVSEINNADAEKSEPRVLSESVEPERAKKKRSHKRKQAAKPAGETKNDEKKSENTDKKDGQQPKQKRSRRFVRNKNSKKKTAPENKEG